MSTWTREQKISLAIALIAFASLIVYILVGFKQELKRAMISQPEIKSVGSPTKQSPTSEPTTNPSPMPTQATNESAAATEPIPNQGWAYYGLQEPDGWTERYFKKESGNSAASPRVGSIVIATGNVNAREGHIEFNESTDKWENKEPPLGIIKPGVRLRVLDVYVVQDRIWIKFARVD